MRAALWVSRHHAVVAASCFRQAWRAWAAVLAPEISINAATDAIVLLQYSVVLGTGSGGSSLGDKMLYAFDSPDQKIGQPEIYKGVKQARSQKILFDAPTQIGLGPQNSCDKYVTRKQKAQGYAWMEVSRGLRTG